MKKQTKIFHLFTLVSLFAVSFFFANAQVTPYVSVTLSTNVASGIAPLTGIDFFPVVSGTATGDINYTYYCNRADTETSISSGYAQRIENAYVSTYPLYDICSYVEPGVYTAKIIVERGGVASENRVEITVEAAPTPIPTPTLAPTASPTATVTPTPSVTPTPTPSPAPSPSPVQSATEIQSEIAELIRQISQLQTQITGVGTTPTPTPIPLPEFPAEFKFSLTLKLGQKSEDVRQLQVFLKAQGQNIYPEGLITGYFGNLTKQAVIRFQEKYSLEILTPIGLTKGTGVVGQKTIIKINQILGK